MGDATVLETSHECFLRSLAIPRSHQFEHVGGHELFVNVYIKGLLATGVDIARC